MPRIPWPRHVSNEEIVTGKRILTIRMKQWKLMWHIIRNNMVDNLKLTFHTEEKISRGEIYLKNLGVGR